MVEIPTLTKNERNLYAYFVHHRKHRAHVPCFVPKNPINGNYHSGRTKDQSYIHIIEKLEKYGLFRVDRRGGNYQQWILLP